MKTKFAKKIIAQMLCGSMLLAMVLTGCSGDASEAESVSLVGKQVVSVQEAKETVVFSIQGEPVTLDEVYLYYMQYIFNNKISADAMTEEKRSQCDSSVIGQVMLDTAEYLMALKMDDLKLTDEEMEQAKVSADNFYKYFGEDTLANYGIDEESVEKLFEKQAYVTAVNNKAIADLSESNMEEFEKQYKDLNFHSITYALFPSVKYDENGNAVLDKEGKQITLSSEEMKEQLEKAGEFYEKAVAGQQSMEELTKEYGIEHCSGVERNYEGAYSKELNDVVKKLNEGDISEVITTDAGYMIARLDKKNDEEYKEYMISYAAQQRAQELLPKMQESWAEQAGLDYVVVDEAVVDAVDVKALCSEMKMKGYY